MAKTIRQTLEAAMAAVSRGDLGQAQGLADSVLAIAPSDPNALQIRGLVFARTGRLTDALAAFREAERILPNHPPILNSIGALHRDLGDYESALPYLKRAAACAPGFAQAHRNLAELAALQGDAKAARQGYEVALQLEPRNSETLGGYALLLESLHAIAEARAAAAAALEIDPGQILAHSALAEIDARNGDYDSVIKRVEMALRESEAGAINRARLLGIQARALEKLGRYADSFSASRSANELLARAYSARLDGALSPISPNNIEKMIAHFDALDLRSPIDAALLGNRAPIFLVGFPRSGTTLLDQILTGSGVKVLEEKPLLNDAALDFVINDDGLRELGRLDTVGANKYRQAFWARATAIEKQIAGHQFVVDKTPLNTALLGVIAQIFPDAKVIFAIRDPRDVVLSCFQQTFGANVAMSQFLTLESAARYYDRVMTLGDICRRKFPIKAHEVRYENLVADFRAEIEPLLEFVGVGWSENASRYAETAKTRIISTPSAKQVIEPIYSRSAGKWRLFENELAPVLPVLDPWVRRFGYQ